MAWSTTHGATPTGTSAPASMGRGARHVVIVFSCGRVRGRSRSVPELVLAGVRNPNGWCDAQYRQHRAASGLRERDRQAVDPSLERQRLLVTDQLNGCDGCGKMGRAFGKAGDQQSFWGPVQRDGVDDVGA